MAETWYAHPNDLFGGWSVLTVDAPPSTLSHRGDGREVATFVSETDARQIAELHNGGTRSALVAAITRLESELATLRRAATRVPPDTDVDLVAQAIHSALCTPLTCVSADMYDAAARAVLVALTGAGRLRDEGDGYWIGHE